MTQTIVQSCRTDLKRKRPFPPHADFRNAGPEHELPSGGDRADVALSVAVQVTGR